MRLCDVCLGTLEEDYRAIKILMEGFDNPELTFDLCRQCRKDFLSAVTGLVSAMHNTKVGSVGSVVRSLTPDQAKAVDTYLAGKLRKRETGHVPADG